MLLKKKTVISIWENLVNFGSSCFGCTNTQIKFSEAKRDKSRYILH